MKLNHDETQHIICDLCGTVSASMVKHKKHQDLVHTVHEKVQCDICKAW